jgi:nucleoside-diphosphate-sugar epimerase
MNALIIGGTGIISTDVVKLALQRGWEITLLNRGLSGSLPSGAEAITCDVHEEAQMEKALAGKNFDVVANFIGHSVEDIERDMRLFRDRCLQYIFVSTCMTYQKPSSDMLITEATPQRNDFAAQNKIACEEALRAAYRAEGFPMTIVRPSWTYNETTIPFIATSWTKPWTLVERILHGKPILVPGDGTSLFTITHASDFAKGFVGLMGNPRSIGHAFHITGQEAMCWNAYLDAIGQAVGVKPNPVHIATDFICAISPELTGDLKGDKIYTMLFDNSKLRSFVPDFAATLPYAQGIRKSLADLEQHPEKKVIDERYTAHYDAIFAAYPSV